MKKLVYGIVALAITIGFTGCSKHEPAPKIAKLNVKFVDSKWDGITVPSDEVCGDYNKKGANSPKLLINNLPSTTNKIILIFNDDSFEQMRNGGHGIVSYEVTEGTKSIEVPSVPSETFNLPTNFKVVKAHGGTPWGKTAGAYLAPCSGGRGNSYSMRVEAIHDFNSEEKKPSLLGDAHLKMGIY